MPDSQSPPPLPATIRHLLFYDGDCALCSRTVRITARADRRGVFGFAPLGGSTAQRHAEALAGRGAELDSMVLLENVGPGARAHRLSRSVLRTLWNLGLPWSLLGVLSFLPSFLFDWVYRFVARTRYAIFGRVEACPLPPARVRSRFLP